MAKCIACRGDGTQECWECTGTGAVACEDCNGEGWISQDEDFLSDEDEVETEETESGTGQ